MDYIIQKWICKRKKSIRYLTDDRHFEEFDNKRLMDTRFFIFMGIISNALFQIQNTLNPLPDTRQFEVNMVYWGITVINIIVMTLSWTNIRFVVLATVIHCIRNIAPCFDPEDRQKAMDEKAWKMLILFQTQGCLIFIMLINSTTD